MIIVQKFCKLNNKVLIGLLAYFLLSLTPIKANIVNLNKIEIKNYYPHINQTHFLKYSYDKEKYMKPSYELISGPSGFSINSAGKNQWKPSSKHEGKSFIVKVIVRLSLLDTTLSHKTKKTHQFIAYVPSSRLLELEKQEKNKIKVKGLDCKTPDERDLYNLTLTVDDEYLNTLSSFKIWQVDSSINESRPINLANKCMFVIESSSFPQYDKSKYTKRPSFKINVQSTNKTSVYIDEFSFVTYSQSKTYYENFVRKVDNETTNILQLKKNNKTENGLATNSPYIGGSTLIGHAKVKHIGNSWELNRLDNQAKWHLPIYTRENEINNGFEYSYSARFVNTKTLFGLFVIKAQ